MATSHTHDSCDYVIGGTRVVCNSTEGSVFEYSNETAEAV